MNLIIFTAVTQAILLLISTPTPNNPWIGEKTVINPPIGWILAGFLILLLISMIYVEIKKFIKRKFRRKTS